MVYQTDKGVLIKSDEKPHYSELHNLFYVAGYRWIKSRQSWSGVCLLHSAQEFADMTPGSAV